MTKKSFLILLALAMLTIGGQAIAADTITANTATVTSQLHSNRTATIEVAKQAEGVKVVASGLEGDVHQVYATVWTQADRSDASVFSFFAEGQGSYASVLDRLGYTTEATDFHIELVAEMVDGSRHTFTTYQFNWLVESTTTLATTSVVDSSTSASTETSAGSTSTVTVPSSSITLSEPTSEKLESDTPIPLVGQLKVVSQNHQAGTFELVVTDVSSPKSLSSVVIPVWSDVGGQDDLVWYTAAKQADGSYKVTVDKAKHKNNTGLYHAHLYYRYADGSQQFVAGAKPVLEEPKLGGHIAVQNQNNQTGTFELRITDVSSPQSLKTILVPVWSDAGGQDDLVWYTATKQADGSYKVMVDKTKHKNNTGLYHAHLYYQYANDSRQFVAGVKPVLKEPQPASAQASAAPAKVAGKLTIQKQDNTAGLIELRISGVSSTKSISSVVVPVWSEINGQDDLVWYTATKQSDGTYKVVIDRKKHKNSNGLYHAHLYYRYADGSKQFVAGAKPVLAGTTPTGQITIENLNDGVGSFDVRITNISSNKTLKTIVVPVWSEAGGQDDLVWYTATKQADGSYKVTINKERHKHSTGLYHVHLYYHYTDGSKQIVAGAKPVLAQYRPTGYLYILGQNDTLGRFDALVRDIQSSKTVESVRMAVWSESGGQDDLTWYTASERPNRRYKISVDRVNHKNSIGIYHVHVYFRHSDGGQSFVTAIKVNLSPAFTTGEISIQKQNNQTGSFEVHATDVTSTKPGGFSPVRVAVWSEAGGQDDLVWHQTTQLSDGHYVATIDRRKHKNTMGVYHVHAYHFFRDGTRQFLDATKVTMQATKPSGQIKVTYNPQRGDVAELQIIDIYAPKPLKQVQVPVWSEKNGQDDIIWYTATKQADGTYKLPVNIKDHKNSTGVYHAHLYYSYTDGALEAVSAKTLVLTKPKPYGKLTAQNLNQDTGTFDVRIADVFTPKTLNKVIVPIWSETNGQDDIVWYEAKKQTDGSYKVSVDKKNHKNSIGVYNIHLYYNHTDGSLEGAGGITTKLEEVKPAGKLSIQNKDNSTGSFDIIVTNVKGATSVLIPVWSEVNGQDDIVWYGAEKQGADTYKLSIQAKNHGYSKGNYHVHLYLKTPDNQTVGADSTVTSVDITSLNPRAKISIENINSTYGIFEVVVSEVFAPKGVTAVHVPVWSEANGQNDVRWYEAIAHSDGTYRLMVRLANHNYETGLYHAHLYITTGGQQLGVGGTTSQMTYTKKSVPSFIDVSSHNGSLSMADYRTLMNQGVSGVVVKLTEGVEYLNPFAAEQIRNAQAVGLKVSVYHYSHFTSAAEAQAEARYFVEAAKRLGLPNSVVMVNDIEENKTRNNINANMQAWEAEMRRLGYNNLVHYTGASWIDVNTLGVKGPIQTSLFGLKNFWVAQYPYYSGMTLKEAGEMNLHSSTAAWQFTSQSRLLPGRSFFDLNIDYTNRFTN